MSRTPNPSPKPYVAKDGTRTWRVPFRMDGLYTSETFATFDEAMTFCADARDFKSYRTAVARLEERRRQADNGPSGPTLATVFEEFVAWKAQRVRSSRTVEEYRRYFEAVGPTLGGRPVDTITEADVQRWVEGQTAGTVAPKVQGRGAERTLVPVSAKTIANRHGMLHAVFAFAASPARRYCATNPCASTELPKRRKGAPKGLRPAEWQALHAALQQVNPDGADLALALYATGARFGEITALSTFDVEDDGELVTLSIGHVIRREAGNRFRRVEDTKSEAGFRTVTVDAHASAMFRRRVAGAKAGALADQPHIRLIFANREGRVWLPVTFRAGAWMPALELASLSRHPTPHWLRHTHVAEMLASGADLPELQRRLGHESITTTIDTYGRMGREVDRDLLARFAHRSAPAQIEGTVVPGELA